MKVMTKLALALGVVGMSTNIMAANVQLNFDGSSTQVYEYSNMTVDGSGNIVISITGSGSGGNSSASSSSSSSNNSSSSDASSNSSTASSSSSIDAGSCGALPANTILESAYFDWDTATPARTLYMSRRSVHAYPVTTTANPAMNGQLSLAYLANSSKVRKTIWISECPGGESIAPTNVCKKESALTTNVFWALNDNVSWRCPLQPNTNYYINVQNVGESCEYSYGCNAILQHIYSGSPN